MNSPRAFAPTILAACACLLAVLVVSPSAQAHRVNLFAWVEGDVVHAEATFAGGKKPSMDSPVDVLDAASGVTYLETRTDDAGALSFTVPQAARLAKADLRLVLHASMGHQAEWVVKADEYLGAAAQPASGGTAAAAMPSPEASTVTPPASMAPADAAPDDAPNDAVLSRMVEQAVGRAVGRAVETHIAPLKRMLAEQSEAGPSLSDIVGGLGWIFGLVGVGAWMRARSRED